MALLEGKNLRKTYRLSRRVSVPALRGVDVALDRGEMVAITGTSGSGKSTLMHILGLLQAPEAIDDPQPTLHFDGTDVTALSDADRTRLRAVRLGFVFQDFNLVPTLTALENVQLAGTYAGNRGARARRLATDALDAVGLADRAGHRPAELSGGQQQRVAIARALVNEPSLVLADEPTGNLDSEGASAVVRLLLRANRERRQTCLIVTHEPEVAAICDRVIRMRDGRVVESSTGAQE